MKRTMKIKINVTVEVDAQKWANEYGIDRKDVRADVKTYFDGWIQSHINDLGLGLLNRHEPQNRAGDGFDYPAF